ncbi:hypothetical protein T484DRAFT_1816571 [Baffinella frigidus]|nr:hypothetical protein T484DRAFT_1816571 [Cryptophyta sp. CCMP2293]
MHHAVGATPLAEESFVKIPREHARVPAQHQGEVQDNWPFQDTSPPAVEEGGVRAGGYMHHRAAAGDRTA